MSRGRICSRCYRERAQEHRRSEERIGGALDSVLDVFFWGHRTDGWL